MELVETTADAEGKEGKLNGFPVSPSAVNITNSAQGEFSSDFGDSGDDDEDAIHLGDVMEIDGEDDGGDGPLISLSPPEWVDRCINNAYSFMLA